MERLSIDEVIEHCKRHTERMESHSGRSQLEETPIGNSNIMKQYWEHRQVAEWLEQLKTYKDLEDQGLLLRLPCKIGDTVYRIYHYPSDYISQEKFYLSLLEMMGKKVFLTKEEADAALARMEGKNE